MRRLIALLALCAAAQPQRPFVVRVTDEATGRGVPLVELKLPNAVEYWTDSAGVAALIEPSFEGRRVFVEVASHGYEFPQETVMGRGELVEVRAGGSVELKVRRVNIAERLYRLTGEGIYRDSVLAGLRAASPEAQMKAQVLGQDTVSAAIYGGRIFWIWGDTIGPDYWNFSVSGATSALSDDPAVGVNYRYFTDGRGRSRAMLPLPRKGLVWIEGLLTLKDPQGRERLVATYTRQDGLKPPEECGAALFDDGRAEFEPWFEYRCRQSHYSAHPFRHDGRWYLYPWLRVPDDWRAFQDVANWEERAVKPPSRPKRISCVVWNEYRRRWIMLLEDSGDVYYAEADAPEGPYSEAVRIIHHDQYNFYNVATHPFFNREGGRVIFIEGTYTDAFTGAKQKTPRYNYNQVMYRLRLDDERLRTAAAHR